MRQLACPSAEVGSALAGEVVARLGKTPAETLVSLKPRFCANNAKMLM